MAHSVGGLIRWMERSALWLPRFAEHFERCVGQACDDFKIKPPELEAIIGDNAFGHLWGGVFEDLLTHADDAGHGLVDDYLAHRGKKENVASRAYLRALSKSTLGIYEISDVVRDVGFLARDLVHGGEPVRVSERLATRSLSPWECIAARLIALDGVTIMSGSIMMVERESIDRAIAKPRKRVSRRVKTAAGDGLEAARSQWAPQVIDLWLRSRLEQIVHPREPTLVNSEGDPIEWVTLTYRLATAGARQDAQAALRAAPELREETDGVWNWIGPPPSRHAKAPAGSRSFIGTLEDGALVLGMIELKTDQVVVQVNSRPRAERARDFVRAHLGALVGEPGETIEDVDSKTANQDRKEGSSLPVPPEEARRIIHVSLDDHYRRTLDERVGMLGNRTPRAAARSATGRDAVVAWLEYLENQTARNPPGDPLASYDFGWMWRELGVADKRR